MFSVFRDTRIPFKATALPQHFFFFGGFLLSISTSWISRWWGLSHDPRNEIWPKHKLGQVRPGKGKCQIYKCHYKQLMTPSEVVAPLVLVDLAQGRSCLRFSQMYRGTARERMVPNGVPSLPFTVGLATLWTQDKMQHSWSRVMQHSWSCHVSSGVHGPSSKNMWCENGKLTLVENKLKKGNSGGEGF